VAEFAIWTSRAVLSLLKFDIVLWCMIVLFRHVGFSTGPRTYYLKNDLARLEQALVQFSLDTLLQKHVGVFLINYMQFFRCFGVTILSNGVQEIFYASAS
jgi:seryl-tRNA synthetase